MLHKQNSRFHRDLSELPDAGSRLFDSLLPTAEQPDGAMRELTLKEAVEALAIVRRSQSLQDAHRKLSEMGIVLMGSR